MNCYESLRRLCRVVSLLALLHGTPALANKTAQSWSGARAALQTSDAKKIFDDEMSGGPLSDGFGVKLPVGFSKDFLAEQLAPGQDVRSVVLAGAKPWPQRPNSYVAVVCLADSPDAAASDVRYPEASCDSAGDNGRRRVWFGVFERDGAGNPRLLARTEEAVATPTDWRDTDIDLPMDVESADAASEKNALPSMWSRFDLAPYRLRDGQSAFGVRAGWHEDYSGGGAVFEALYLFLIEGKSLRVVFAQPMVFEKMISGGFNESSHTHDMSDAANALLVLPSLTDGYHDLELREKGRKRWQRLLKWSAAQQRYVPSP